MKEWKKFGMCDCNYIYSGNILFFYSREVREITDEQKQVQSEIRRLESSLENPNDIARKYEYARSRQDQVAAAMDALRDNIKDLNSSVKKREQYCNCTEDYFVHFTNYTFSKVLEFRQFKVGY